MIAKEQQFKIYDLIENVEQLRVDMERAKDRYTLEHAKLKDYIWQLTQPEPK